MEKIGHFINGKWVYEGETFQVNDKYTGECIANVHTASRELVHQAVVNAAETFHSRKLSADERYRILTTVARIVQERKDEFAQLLVQEVGKVMKDALLEVDRSIGVLIASAEEAKRIVGNGVPIPVEDGLGRLAFTVRSPVGVIAAITPFNFPLNLTLHKIGPAIAAGNTVVLKPAELTPVIVSKLVEVFQLAGLQDGMLNLVNGYGAETGDYLLEEEQVDMFTFTGSVRVGRQIKSKTGIKKLTLELGNNSPNIIHHDAPDLDQAAELCVRSGFSNSGQACISVQRIYVHSEVYEEFIEKVLEQVKGLKVGDPRDLETNIGPLISEKEAERVEQWIQEAVESGARLLHGGIREKSVVSPAVLVDTTSTMKVICEEVFGPVISIAKYDDIEEVFQIANDSTMGLQAGFFTSNLTLAMRAVERFEFGGIIINGASTYRADTMPYGGIKDSGLGKEGPHYTVNEMTHEKLVVINF